MIDCRPIQVGLFCPTIMFKFYPNKGALNILIVLKFIIVCFDAFQRYVYNLVKSLYKEFKTNWIYLS